MCIHIYIYIYIYIRDPKQLQKPRRRTKRRLSQGECLCRPGVSPTKYRQNRSIELALLRIRIVQMKICLTCFRHRRLQNKRPSEKVIS